jgi:hypothetical protein
MKILYNDVGIEFSRLMQQCMNDRSNVSGIVLSREEMRELVQHKDSARLLSDYMGPIHAQIEASEKRIELLRKRLPKTSTPRERQEIFDEMSAAELSIHKLRNEVPTKVVQSGVTIKVSMKG